MTGCHLGSIVRGVLALKLNASSTWNNDEAL